VDYLMVSMLEEVMRTGTAAGVRSRGFTAPAGGKTGTSHDGWFAGFTSNLLCIVWVGFDDNRELDIEGAKSALPIWTEFMKRAVTLRPYSDVKPFAAPEGVVTVTIDPDSGMPASPQCPREKDEVFIAGTEPVGICSLHGGHGDQTTVSGWDLPANTQPKNPAPTPYAPPPRRADQPAPAVTSVAPPASTSPATPYQPAVPPPGEQPKPKKKSFFGRLKDVFK
jgi:penicillin-binding protein 1B